MTNKEILKKQIIYRSNHRGVKEMDLLLGSFVKKYINNLQNDDLQDLMNILLVEDEIIQKWYFEKVSDNPVFNTNISTLLKNFKVYSTFLYGGESGIRTHERVAPLLVCKTSAFNRSAISPHTLLYFS